MISCRRAQALMMEAARGAATEAERLLVDEHLMGCADCRAERARWALIETLKTQEPIALGTRARERVLAAIVAEAGKAPRQATLPSRSRRRWVAVGGVALAAAAAVVVYLRSPAPAPLAPVEAPKAVAEAPAPVGPPDGHRLCAERPGEIVVAGARLAYHRGTAAILHASQRRVVLQAGEVDVDSAGEHRFEVIAPTFRVEVTGTRFVVSPSRVETLRGKARILREDGVELAAIETGQSWEAPAGVSTPEATACPTVATASRPTVVPPTAPPPPAAPTVAPAPRPQVDVVLDEARHALAEGDMAATRALTGKLRRSALSGKDAAAFDLLLAEALLVEHRQPEALAAFRNVVRRHAGAAEGESASFAIAQILSEGGDRAAAAGALRSYLAQFPSGRFAREARERLAQLDPAP